MLGDAEPLMADVATLTPAVDDQDHSRGLATAPVTLVFFGDYSPRACRVWPIIHDLRRRLGLELRVVARHFQPDEEGEGNLMAQAVEAAGKQGQFWQMHDLLCRHTSASDVAAIEEDGRSLGLDMERFDSDRRSQAVANTIREQTESGVRSGVETAPAIFINGIRYQGPIDPGRLTQAIQQTVGP